MVASERLSEKERMVTRRTAEERTTKVGGTLHLHRGSNLHSLALDTSRELTSLTYQCAYDATMCKKSVGRTECNMD